MEPTDAHADIDAAANIAAAQRKTTDTILYPYDTNMPLLKSPQIDRVASLSSRELQQFQKRNPLNFSF